MKVIEYILNYCCGTRSSVLTTMFTHSYNSIDSNSNHSSVSILRYIIHSRYFNVLIKVLQYEYVIVYKHWPDTREFVTRIVELWNRRIRLSCYYCIRILTWNYGINHMDQCITK